MLKKIAIAVIWLVVLLPVCGLAGYAIGLVLAPIWYDVEVDRELFAGIYGIPLIGLLLYVPAAILVIFRVRRLT